MPGVAESSRQTQNVTCQHLNSSLCDKLSRSRVRQTYIINHICLCLQPDPAAGGSVMGQPRVSRILGVLMDDINILQYSLRSEVGNLHSTNVINVSMCACSWIQQLEGPSCFRPGVADSWRRPTEQESVVMKVGTIRDFLVSCVSCGCCLITCVAGLG